MPVVAVNIRHVNAQRKEDYNGPIQIGHNTALKDVVDADFGQIGKKGLKIPFEFRTDYKTDKNKIFAEIVMQGEVLILADNTVEVLKSWKKDKKIPEAVNIEAINAVIRKCLTRAITLSEEIQLPPPVPMPFAQKQEDQQQTRSRYIG